MAGRLQAFRTAVLKAFIDESGIHEGSPVLTVAAYLGRQNVWRHWTKKWNVAKRPIGVVHAADAANLKGEFRDWTHDRVAELAKTLLPIIANAEVAGMVIGIHMEEYRKAIAGHPELALLLGNPYSACFHWLVSTIIHLANEQKSDERIAFIHENNDYESESLSAFGWIEKVINMENRIAYADLTVQETLLRQAIDLYRDRNQGPILTRAKSHRGLSRLGPYRCKIRERGRHWLNMMYPRLMLARSLLRPDGVIFVSIDDSESANLKRILDECFGDDNFIDTIAVEMSTTSGPKTVNAQQGTIVKNVEFVHVYRRSAEFDSTPHTPLLDGVESYDTHYSVWLNDDGTLGTLADTLLADKQVGAEIRKHGFMEREGFSINNLNRLLVVSEAAKAFVEANLKQIARVDRPPVSASRRSTKVGRWESFEADHRTYFLTTLANGTLQALTPLSLNYRMSDDYKPRFGRTVIRGDLWKGFHQDMGNVAKEGEIAFPSGKKPVRLIKQLIKWSDSARDAIILDFFAGSGTTAHAVMQLNAEDGGKRAFILVQLPEPLDQNNSDQKAAADFCDKLGTPRSIAELTKERLRRTAAKMKNENAMFAGDLGFRVFKLASSNIRAWERDRDNLAATLEDAVDHLKSDRTEQDVLYELLLKLGLDLCVPVEAKTLAGKAVHSIGGGVLIACLAEKIERDEIEKLGLGIVEWHKALTPAGDTTFVFRDSAFADDVAKTNLAAILEQNGIATVRSL
jgi:adenine-specific DNA-methyltransferase